MSAPGKYLNPLDGPRQWDQFDRRTSSPLSELSRKLDRLCRHAADPLEIAAHLEALGYDDPKTLEPFGVSSHFALAEKLFDLVPRRHQIRGSVRAFEQKLAKQTVILLTLTTTVAVGLAAEVSSWTPVILLMVWSQLGGGLMARAESVLTREDRDALVSLLCMLGALGLGVLWVLSPFPLTGWTMTMSWLTAALLLWADRHRLALLASACGVLAVAAYYLGLIDLPAAVSLQAAAATLFLLPALREAPAPQHFVWSWGHRHYLLLLAVYGAGQGLIMIRLLSGNGRENLPGLLLFALVLLVSEPLLIRFKERLAHLMWKLAEPSRFIRGARLTLLLYAGIFLLPVEITGVLWYLGPDQAWLHHLFSHALFALGIILAVTKLAFRGVLVPCLSFAGGGLAVTAGAPLLMVLVLLAALQFASLWRRIERLGSYGIHIA